MAKDRARSLPFPCLAMSPCIARAMTGHQLAPSRGRPAWSESRHEEGRGRPVHPGRWKAMNEHG